MSIIGKPTKAIVKADKLHIEGRLFADNPKAVEVYKLQKILEKEGLGLGFSIEGQVIERDPKNSAIVTKARITGCAITKSPKNKDTVMSIIKSNNFTKLNEEDMEDEDDEKTEEKAMTTASGAALMTESVDGSTKKIEKSDNITEKEGNIKKKDLILPSNIVTKANKFYDFVTKIQTQMNKQDDLIKVSQEAIEKAEALLNLNTEPTREELLKAKQDELQKALDAINLELGVGAEDVVKAEDTDLVKAKKDDEDEDDDKDVEKAKKSEDEDEDEGDDSEDEKEEEMGDDDDKKSSDKEKSTPAADGYGAVADHSDFGSINKGEFADILKGHFDTLNTSLEAKIEAKVGEMTELNKGLVDQISTLTERLEMVEEQDTAPRSITTRKFIEKADDSDELVKADGNTSLSVSNLAHRRIFLNKAVDIITGPNADPIHKGLHGDIMNFEYDNKSMPSTGLINLAKANGITLMK